MSADVVPPQVDGASREPTGPTWFDRLLWLGPRVAEARANGFRAGRPGFELFDVAREIHDEASKIRRSGRSPWVLLMLDGLAVEWLVRAHLTRAGQVPGPGPLAEADWAAVQHVAGVESAWAKFPARHLSTLVTIFGADRVGPLLQLAESERESFALHLRELAQDLIEPLEVEANRLAWAVFARWSRIAVFATLLLAMLAWAGSWVRAKMSPNLAFHRPVFASSLNGYGPDATRLVDGITDEIGFHTNGGDQQWVVIDLGDVKKFDKIVVYNRPDCCGERAVPLKVEVSNDNRSFTQIAERSEVFDKWTVNHLRTEGRYIRLKNTPPNYFHLAEVEVY
jgi:hypothetical protein